MAKIKTIQVELSPDDVSDILIAASEGGTNYWAILTERRGRDDEDRITSLTLAVEEEYDEAEDCGGDYQTYVVNAESVETAVNAILRGEGHPAESYVTGYILDAMREDDMGHIDADAADVIVQVACFGKSIFG